MKEIVNELNLISEQTPDAFIVGGFVRNALSGKISHDVDIVVSGDVLGISRAFSNAVSGAWFPLDEERNVYRVVLKKENEWFFDFAPLRRGDIKSDLLERDFTVDAIALPVKEWETPRSFIDPTGGIADLKERVVRMVSRDVFKDDPLRLFRAFRIALQIDGKICEETLSRIRKDAALISGVSGERIRDELYRILEARVSAEWCSRIFETGLFHFSFPEFAAFDDTRDHYFHKGGLWEHSFETLKKFEDKFLSDDFGSFPEFSDDLKKYFDRRKAVLTKIGCLLHDIGKPSTASTASGRLRFFGHERAGSFLARNIMKRLKASRQDIRFVSDIVFSHMRPSNLSALATRKAFFRFFNAFATDAHIATVFTALCDRYSYESVSNSPGEITGQTVFTKKILEAFYRQVKIEKKQPLLNGNEVMEHLKIGPGRLVGLILEEIRAAEVCGRVKTKEEAVEFAKKIKDEIPLKEATIIIPAFNEEKTLGSVLINVSKIPRSWEVIVVDDGSRDKTSEIAGKFNVRVIKHARNIGKGAAVRTAVKEARGKYIAIQDADGEYDFSELRNIIEYAIKEGLPAVYGSRFLKRNPVRYVRYFLGNFLVSLFISALFLRRVTDSYTCYKVVKSKVLKSFSLFSKGFEIEAEVTSRVLKKGIKILEVPINYKPRTVSEGKKIKPVDGIKAILTALRVRFAPCDEG
ncbi:MAG: glycosyltransferase [bacterium]